MKTRFNIALAGVPNCGKTTLFNSLTGSNQTIGNWSGVTVEKIEGYFNIGEQKINIVDLPGMDNLSPNSEDQKIAANEINNESFDAVINVVNATSLNKSLFLTFDILEIAPKTIIFLNMADLAAKESIKIDIAKLSKKLNIRVIPITSIDKNSVKQAKEELEFFLNQDETNLKTTLKIPKSPKDRYLLIDKIVNDVQQIDITKESITNKIDKILLDKYLSLPFFLVIMFLTFWFAIGIGSIFIDFFDMIGGLLFVDIPTLLLENLSSPEWLIGIIGGVGTGLQTVATFVPVVFFMFLALAILQDIGYMSRATVIADRFLKKIGLPGTVFIPLIVGFGCTVPAVMATRALKTKRERYTTIFMAPFMSCGARLPVYALFCAAIFKENSALAVFLIYMIGMATAVLTGLLLKNTLFKGQQSAFNVELPLYHKPKAISILKRSFLQLKLFIKKAGIIITVAVFILSIFSTIGIEEDRVTWGADDSENSLLAYAGKGISPIFEPIVVSKENWPASVALFTGLFAKEAIVGTLNSLYMVNADADNFLEESDEPEDEGLKIGETITEAFGSITDGFIGIVTSFDLLGLGLTTEDEASIGEELETDSKVFSELKKNFSPISGFAYMIFILMYFPCLAVIGAAKQEMGNLFTIIMVGYTTLIGWVLATLFYQIAEGHSGGLITLAIGFLLAIYIAFLKLGKKINV